MTDADITDAVFLLGYDDEGDESRSKIMRETSLDELIELIGHGVAHVVFQLNQPERLPHVLRRVAAVAYDDLDGALAGETHLQRPST